VGFDTLRRGQTQAIRLGSRYLRMEISVSVWHHHPGVRSGKSLTAGDRAADAMRNGMGSWPFVFAALGFLTIWMIYNGRHGFDPYPFILLNLVLSCLAAMQGAILLIAAKRSDTISSELAKHTFDIDQESLTITMQIHDLTKKIDALTEIIHAHVAGDDASPPATV
jgi:uncharacterized membrane protein